ncbi:hypothetical protein llap_22373 [Limosa lapponica baueri]|uniref:Uncharacterized protein n=1 Tax=Limosa lapponica baueri TaxID=1758121 RepID=A0A2I0T0J6_LIMLA|nr:hypothetical protein llap_22373 [Limosa lapponica baueri]
MLKIMVESLRTWQDEKREKEEKEEEEKEEKEEEEKEESFGLYPGGGGKRGTKGWVGVRMLAGMRMQPEHGDAAGMRMVSQP